MSTIQLIEYMNEKIAEKDVEIKDVHCKSEY